MMQADIHLGQRLEAAGEDAVEEHHEGVVDDGAGVTVLAWGYADVTGRWSFDLVDLVDRPAEGRFQTAAFFLLIRFGGAAFFDIVNGRNPKYAHWLTKV